MWCLVIYWERAVQIYCRIPQAQGYVDTLANTSGPVEYNDNDTFIPQYDEHGLSREIG